MSYLVTVADGMTLRRFHAELAEVQAQGMYVLLRYQANGLETLELLRGPRTVRIEEQRGNSAGPSLELLPRG